MEVRSLFAPGRSVSRAAAAAAVLLGAHLAARPAHAYVEARCPPEWNALPAPGGGGQRVVALCVKEPMQLVAQEFEQRIAPSTPRERDAAEQLLAGLRRNAELSLAAFRTERLGAVQVRVAALTGSTPGEEGGGAQRLEGAVMIVPVGTTGSVTVLALSQEPARGNATAAARAFVPTMVGLDGSVPAWRANASCPGEMESLPPAALPGSGARRVVFCATRARQVDVSESRLPVRAAEDARAAAQAATVFFRAQVERAGAQLAYDAPQPATVNGTNGFVVAVHGAGARFEGSVLVLPTTAGHVRVAVASPNDPAPAVAQFARTFATSSLRLDGTAPPASAGGGDGGAAREEGPPGPSPAAAPRRRRAEEPEDEDPQPWTPPRATRPQATAPRSKGGCGCAVPGGAGGAPGAASALGAGALALARGARRRRRGR